MFLWLENKFFGSVICSTYGLTTKPLTGCFLMVVAGFWEAGFVGSPWCHSHVLEKRNVWGFVSGVFIVF